jgi:hypothetical protein
MSTINFKAKLSKIGSVTLLSLPKSVSSRLPSRGMTMVKGTINGFPFQVVLEPDGRGSHWFKVDKTMSDGARLNVGDTVTLEIEPSSEWSEPALPTDFKKALDATSHAHTLWMDITPMARWDWIRWMGATKQPETRKKRINKAFSMLKAGKRRPCCFNRTECTVQDVSNHGILLEVA